MSARSRLSLLCTLLVTGELVSPRACAEAVCRTRTEMQHGPSGRTEGPAGRAGCVFQYGDLTGPPNAARASQGSSGLGCDRGGPGQGAMGRRGVSRVSEICFSSHREPVGSDTCFASGGRGGFPPSMLASEGLGEFQAGPPFWKAGPEASDPETPISGSSSQALGGNSRQQ